ncbi:hypothetical protein DVR12_19415 [Chitinophaga silvatica]|uniref:DUF4476 domain-containing protein n=1 Tax=Chitinophaga silvatica TaxID=2282649 RepID=A0A3E1Y762_9BACT|nr:hypothetical protein [Chitinophaga silvatica]RFS20728.1 hypothetical protein DVR12_19415 [Chitinophaga silvatica]
MKKVFSIVPVLLLVCSLSFAQNAKGLSFYDQYITAQSMIKSAMKYSDPEKIALFLNEANRATMNAKSVFNGVKQKLTPKEASDMNLALDFLLNWSTKDYFEDQDVMKAVLWFKLNDEHQKTAIAKILK